MEIKTIIYHKTFNLGNYSNEKIGVEIALSPDENPLDAFAEAKKHVEKSHQFFQDMPKYEMAKKVVSNPDDHKVRDVKAYEEVMKAFEANYPDYISKFMPASRTLEQGETSNDFYDEED